MSAFEKVGDVQFVSQKGNYYSFKLDDDVWYGHGDQKPDFDKGDKIKFSGSTNTKNGVTYMNADPSSVKVKKGEGTVKPYKGKGGGGTGAKSAESKAYWDKRMAMDTARVEFEHEKHVTIGEFSVRNSAIAYLDLLQKVGGLPIAKLKTAAAIHKAMDACLDAIIEKFNGVVPTPAQTAEIVEFKSLEDKDEFETAPVPATTETIGETDDSEEW